jgi:hypothetical protein
MGSSREYWQYARECARWAKESHNKEEHDLFVDMARAWTHVALTDVDVARAAPEECAKEPNRTLHS